MNPKTAAIMRRSCLDAITGMIEVEKLFGLTVKESESIAENEFKVE